MEGKRLTLLILGVWLLLVAISDCVHSSTTCDDQICSSNYSGSSFYDQDKRIFSLEYTRDLNFEDFIFNYESDPLNVLVDASFLNNNDQKDLCLSASGYILDPAFCSETYQEHPGLTLNTTSTTKVSSSADKSFDEFVSYYIQLASVNTAGADGVDGKDVSELCAEAFYNGDFGQDSYEYFANRYGLNQARCEQADLEWLSKDFACSPNEINSPDGKIDLSKYISRRLCVGTYVQNVCLERKSTLPCELPVPRGYCCDLTNGLVSAKYPGHDKYVAIKSALSPYLQGFESWVCDPNKCTTEPNGLALNLESGYNLHYSVPVSETDVNPSNYKQTCENNVPESFQAPSTLTLTPNYLAEYDRFQPTYNNFHINNDRSIEGRYFIKKVHPLSRSNKVSDKQYENMVRVPQLGLNRDSLLVSFPINFSIDPPQPIKIGVAEGSDYYFKYSDEEGNIISPPPVGTNSADPSIKMCLIDHNPQNIRGSGSFNVTCTTTDLIEPLKIKLFSYTESGHRSDIQTFHIGTRRKFGNLDFANYNKGGADATVPNVSINGTVRGQRDVTGFEEICSDPLKKHKFNISEMTNFEHLVADGGQLKVKSPVNCFSSISVYGPEEVSKIGDYAEIYTPRWPLDGQGNCPSGTQPRNGICAQTLYVRPAFTVPISNYRKRSYQNFAAPGTAIGCGNGFSFLRGEDLTLRSVSRFATSCPNGETLVTNSDGTKDCKKTFTEAECIENIESFIAFLPNVSSGLSDHEPKRYIWDDEKKSCYKYNVAIVEDEYNCDFYNSYDACVPENGDAPCSQDLMNSPFLGAGVYTTVSTRSSEVVKTYPRIFDPYFPIDVMGSSGSKIGASFFQPIGTSWTTSATNSYSNNVFNTFVDIETLEISGPPTRPENPVIVPTNQ